MAQRVPIAVDLRLRLAVDHERDRVIERSNSPALMAVNGCPNKVNSTTSTDPGGPLGESLAIAVTRSMRESGKIDT